MEEQQSSSVSFPNGHFLWSAVLVSVHTRFCVISSFLSPPSFFPARVPAVMSRDAPIVHHKSEPGEAQETGQDLTASLFSRISAANQANGRNSDAESIRSPVAPRHISMVFKPLRISALLC